MKVVIVGGVAGGATAAARLRRLDENADITVFERSGHVSYANCGLPYYIGGSIKEETALTLHTPESFKRRFRVDVRVGHEVTAIHRDRKTVSVKVLLTGETFEQPYDKLLLSPGARPTLPDMPGLDSSRLFTLRTVEDTLRIRNFLDTQEAKSVAIAGGGFVGMELAENLREAGLEVTLLQRGDQLLLPLDRDMARLTHREMEAHGVRLRFDATVVGYRTDKNGIETLLEDGSSVRTDLAVLAIGVTPDTALAKSAGLELGARGSIAVDEHMRTSDPDIYAVGDAVQIPHWVTGQPSLISLAGPANKQGRVAADNMAGLDSIYRGATGSSVIKVFDLTAACTGLNETAAKAANIDYEKVVLSPASHAGYYPGGSPMTLKVLFRRDSGAIIGAQAVGKQGVDKRMDVLATAMQADLTAADLTELDLCYAPPYSSAKDPVNMAGFIMDNIQSGRLQQFHWHDLPDLPADGSVTLLDTRTPMEYGRGHAPGFVNIPVDELRDRLGELPAGKPVYVMCQSGVRSYISCRILSQNGFEAYNFSGGFKFYELNGGPIHV